MPRLLDAANALSLSRIGLAGLVWLRPDHPVFLFTIVAAAAISDMLDGWFARRSTAPDLGGSPDASARAARPEGTAHVGAWLDPVCDKIFVTSAAFAVFVTYGLPASVVFLLLTRDVAMAVLTILLRVIGGVDAVRRHDFRATWSGKLTTVFQIGALFAAVVAPAAVLPLAASAFGAGLIAVGERAFHFIEERRDSGDDV